jgi:hypothetical protein
VDVFKKAVQIAPSLSPNVAGEMLREAAFTADGYGCYSNFNLRDGFDPFPPECLGLHDLTLLVGCFAKDPETLSGVSAFHHKVSGAWLAWHWDGDGTLLFRTRDHVWVNSDCKKDYKWEHSPTWAADCVLNDKYYE